MKNPTASQLYILLSNLDWNGQIEPGQTTLRWLSEQLAAKLNPKGPRRCDSCGTEVDIVVDTPVGVICADCIETFEEQMQEIRETLEG